MLAAAADYRPPAEDRPAARRPGAPSILPGGRAITPLGKQYFTGPGPFGLAVNPKGTIVATADGGPGRFALTTIQKTKEGWRLRSRVLPKNKEEEQGDDDADWRSVFMGLAFEDDDNLFASEGNSGRVRHLDAQTGARKRIYDLNVDGYKDSYTGDMVFDRERRRLYVVDQANFRVAAIDTRARKVAGSVRVGRLPFAVALSPDGRRLYVTNLGMFEYKPIPGADPKQARATGLPFPAFGFPSEEAVRGAQRETGAGVVVDVPGLGSPNAAEANTVAIVNVEDPARLQVEAFVPTGTPFPRSLGGSSPSGITATKDHVFVSNGHNDSITVISALTGKVEKEIVLRIPGLEAYRGLLPVGSYYYPQNNWLLVACAGINAIAVIDLAAMQPLALLPTAWFPTRVVVKDATVYVTCAKGSGTGPNAGRGGPIRGSFQGEMRRGSVSSFVMPEKADMGKLTAQVLYNNGLLPQKEPAAPLPKEIQHVVIIVKENRTFDEVLGDIEQASNGAVAGLPILARFGKFGIITSGPGELQTRLAIRGVSVTPNHHALAQQFAISDNFYADSEVSVDGHHWLVGVYPNAWTESTLMAAYAGQKDFRMPATAPGRLLFPGSNSSVHPEEQLEAGALWHHLERHKVTFRNFGEGFELAGADEGEGLKPTGARYLTNVPMPDPLYRNTSRKYPNYNMNIPDQFRATQFINEMEELYGKTGAELPRLLYIHLPNDHMAKARPDDGYPFAASYVADNDYALGRIVEYLSKSKWWPKMAILVTEDDAQGGVDHIDSHRTLFFAISPYAKRNYVSHVNSSFPGLLKTAFRLLGLPPLNLFDAAAADLADCFQLDPDMTPYEKKPVPLDVFDPAKAKEPQDGTPGPRIDDPNVLRQQHRDRR